MTMKLISGVHIASSLYIIERQRAYTKHECRFGRHIRVLYDKRLTMHIIHECIEHLPDMIDRVMDHTLAFRPWDAERRG